MRATGSDENVILKPPRHAHREPFWMARYLGWARWCLKHRLLTVLLTIGFFVASIAMAGRLPTGFLPPDDLSQTQVTLTLPPGSTLAQAKQLAEEARRIVAANPNVKLVYTAIGAGKAGGDPFTSAGASEVSKATLTVNLTHRSERPGLIGIPLRQQSGMHQQGIALPMQ